PARSVAVSLRDALPIYPRAGPAAVAEGDLLHGGAADVGHAILDVKIVDLRPAAGIEGAAFQGCQDGGDVLFRLDHHIALAVVLLDRKSTRLNSSHVSIS